VRGDNLLLAEHELDNLLLAGFPAAACRQATSDPPRAPGGQVPHSDVAGEQHGLPSAVQNVPFAMGGPVCGLGCGPPAGLAACSRVREAGAWAPALHASGRITVCPTPPRAAWARRAPIATCKSAHISNAMAKKGSPDSILVSRV